MKDKVKFVVTPEIEERVKETILIIAQEISAASKDVFIKSRVKPIINHYEELLDQIYNQIIREGLKHTDTIQVIYTGEPLPDGSLTISRWYLRESDMFQALTPEEDDGPELLICKALVLQRYAGDKHGLCFEVVEDVIAKLKSAIEVLDQL